ncbi:hypothetical protein [Streptomyces sp. MH60]|uniref:hypothetical protein n=1 Tax=Streptomyces sp. MH60 TaxID=1940758 RepID=UPI000D42DF9B|nr:hypothetical protein [Streptomyces sp. MH60]PPS89567.1 hypothetical protein BZZ08_01714 [Streptomyces sp. MH60]
MTRTWGVEVTSVHGMIGFGRVTGETPGEALRRTKERVRDAMLAQMPDGASEYTVSVYAPGHRMGDASVAAERVTLVKLRPGPESL